MQMDNCERVRNLLNDLKEFNDNYVRCFGIFSKDHTVLYMQALRVLKQDIEMYSRVARDHIDEIKLQKRLDRKAI